MTKGSINHQFERQQIEIDDQFSLIHYKRPNSLTSLAFTFLAGALYQPVSMPGMAHFLEHLLVKESQKYSSFYKIKETLNSTASYANAFTNLEFLYLFTKTPDENDVFKVLDIFIDQIANPLLLEDRVEKERWAIIQEIKRNRANSYLSNSRQFLSILTNQRSDLIYPVEGSVEQINKITKNDLASYYQKIRDLKVYITSTGPQEGSELADYMGKTYRFSKKSVSLEPNSVENVQMSAVIKGQNNNIHKNNSIFIRCGIRIKRQDYIEDQAGLELLAEYLGGANGRLLEVLRYEKGLVYSASASVGIYYEIGFFSIITDCSRESLQLVIDSITDQIERVKSGDVDLAKVDTIKNMIGKKMKRDFEQSEIVVRSQIPSTINPMVKDTAEMADLIPKQSVGDIVKVANKYFPTSRLVWSMTGDLKEGECQLPGINESDIIYH